MSNIFDMDDAYLHEACYHASDRLMWDGRQQTEPAEMHRLALAAVCAEMYPDALRYFQRDKVLAAFDLSLTDIERNGILADMESNGGFGSETRDRFSVFLRATAIRHVASDAYSILDSMKHGFPEPNFKAVMERCAEEVSGAGLGSAGRHAGELRMEAKQAEAAQDASMRRDAHVSLNAAAKESRDSSQALAGHDTHGDIMPEGR